MIRSLKMRQVNTTELKINQPPEMCLYVLVSSLTLLHKVGRFYSQGSDEVQRISTESRMAISTQASS